MTYDAYNRANETVDGVKQLIMLYDGAINFAQQAREALVEERHEDRFNLINKVCAIMNGLHECLDFEKGGDVAPALSDFYSSIDMQLITIQHNFSLELCDQVIEQMKSMRDAWLEVALKDKKNQLGIEDIPKVSAQDSDIEENNNLETSEEVSVDLSENNNAENTAESSNGAGYHISA
ncbi:flagellar protein FliS [Rickettsiales bacterium]|nr:flagellar protein FliS [Rickettsiales bacterium]